MAVSPSHKFGQLIGGLLESVAQPQLEDFCQRHGLYLDHQSRNRPARRGRKVTWKDRYGNVHDLDFVIERDGTDEETGRPLAFIEVAWRRYTKHSRNKAQEIQGAIMPLAEKYQWNNPFLGAILAGFFTAGSLDQLESLGFNVLHFQYETLISAFASEGINIGFDEGTADAVFQTAVESLEQISPDRMSRIKAQLVEANRQGIAAFFEALEQRIARDVTRVLVIPLYGRVNEFSTIESAVRFLEEHAIYEGSGEFRKYEVQVEFSNGDRVQASFDAKHRVREFLAFVSRQ